MYKYFKLSEFYCKCGRKHNKQIVDETLATMLDFARENAGIPFRIRSGYRCVEHNREVAGVPDSAHLTGKAADIATPTSANRYAIIKSCIELGFRRIGIYKDFIHVDIDEAKSTRVIWLE